MLGPGVRAMPRQTNANEIRDEVAGKALFPKDGRSMRPTQTLHHGTEAAQWSCVDLREFQWAVGIDSHPMQKSRIRSGNLNHRCINEGGQPAGSGPHPTQRLTHASIVPRHRERAYPHRAITTRRAM